MGSCISKCNPKKTPKKIHKKEPHKQELCQCPCIEKNNNTSIVQDKLVISQTPSSSTTSTSKRSLTTPLSPSKSSSSAASSCTNSNYPTTSSSSSSCSLLSSASSFASSSSSSIISSKLDRSFSNDYLWSCVKENPQAIRGTNNLPLKIALSNARSSLPTRCHTSGKKPNGPKKLPTSSPQTVLRPVAQKRSRCSSPSNLTRQKSFRREHEQEPNGTISMSGRFSRPISPSPSRRFTGDQISQGRAVTKSMRRDNFYLRPPSPSKANTNSSSRRYGRSNNFLVKRNEDCIRGVSSKIEELAIGGLLSSQDMELMPIEDADNPHIALDCFIFL